MNKRTLFPTMILIILAILQSSVLHAESAVTEINAPAPTTSANSNLEKGTVNIITTPSEAKIYVDGKRKGTSSADKNYLLSVTLTEGEHDIRAVKMVDGVQWTVKKSAFFVGGDTTQTLQLKLLAQGKAQQTTTDTLHKNKGVIKISTTPSEAKIFVNGKRKGTSNQDNNQLFTMALPEGEYKIVAQKKVDGQLWQAEKSDVFIGADTEQILTLDLKIKFAPVPITMKDFVKLPKGCFMMGASKAEVQDMINNIEGSDLFEQIRKRELELGSYLQHKVCFKHSFYMQKTEVTQAQWQTVMGENPSYFKGANRPVEQVSWNDVQTFIKKLNAQTGKRYRLPTEAEWEYAARSGSTTSYSFGDDVSKLTDYAWHDQNSFEKTHPVARKKPNAWGLYDIHGNVWEWVYDWWDRNYYKSSPEQDPIGPSSGSSRVTRGGSWNNSAGDTLSAIRYGGAPGGRRNDLGFRLLVQE